MDKVVSNYSCKICKKNFIDLSFFYQHLKNTSHFAFTCPLPKCLKRYNNYSALQRHISLHKDRPINQEALSFKCPIRTCKIAINSRSEYLSHMPAHLNEGETFTCCYPGCESLSGTVASFRSHLSNRHSLKSTNTSPEIDDADYENESSEENNPEPQFVNVQCEPTEEVTQQRPPVTEPENTCHETSEENVEIEDPFAEYNIKDQLAKFYLKLEAEHFLPTSTVQKIAEEIALITEYSHHHLKKSLKPQLVDAGLDGDLVSEIVANTFNSDPVYNTHHKKDAEQFCTDHFRKKFWKKNYPWIEPKSVYLGKDEYGKKKIAQYISIRESIENMLRDPVVKKKVLESFNTKEGSSPRRVLSDITDGSAYQKHRAQHHNGKCIYINLFQDGCDSNAFGPTIGKYKPNNFYFSLGNLSAECRTKLNTIHLVYLILEKHLKNSEGEELRDVDKLREVLKPLLDELEDLKINGIVIDGEKVPVCLLFCQGDNLGQHFIGGFVGSFSCENCCRFCEVSLTEFRENPTLLKPLRTAESYDSSVREAKRSWVAFRNKCLENAEKARNQRLLARIQAPGSRSKTKRILAKSTFQKLKAIHHRGVKYRSSPFNSEMLQFHVCTGPALAPCIVHDFWEGLAKNMVPKILSTFVKKGWFDLDILNSRIETFSYEGSDKADTPTRLKSLDSLGGNACENWTMVRLLPLIIGDLIQDKDDEHWQLFLQFKVIAEYVFAPSITVEQVLYLKRLISEFLLSLKSVLPECLYPKAHLLNHYPELILTFGPLTRLFTLRFESFHVFFKNVAKACRNTINITYTLARKYICKFALDHSRGLISEEVVFDPFLSSAVSESDFSQEERNSIPEEVFSGSHRVLSHVTVKGVEYRNLYYMILDLEDDTPKVGLIEKVFLNIITKKVSFLLNVKSAENTHQGYYKVNMPSVSYFFSELDSLPDYYPLPCYFVSDVPCIVLKHSVINI